MCQTGVSRSTAKVYSVVYFKFNVVYRNSESYKRLLFESVKCVFHMCPSNCESFKINSVARDVLHNTEFIEQSLDTAKRKHDNVS